MNFIKSTLIILLSICSLFAFAEQTTIISQQDFLTLMESPANKTLVLDVRTAEEFAQGHISGAVNISHEQISANLDKIIAFKDQTVIVHCRSGKRAMKAEDTLRAAGFTNLRHLEGDMNGWQAADLPLDK